MKKVINLLLVLLVILTALLFIGKNIIAKAAVTGGVRAVTGLQMDIRNMDVGILKTLIGINGMKLYNPPDYEDKLMIDMPELYVDYDLRAFLKGKVHLEEVRIELKELMVIKNKNGELNIDSLKVAKKEKKSEKPEERKKTEIKIDALDLKIGKVIYKDFSKGHEPTIREYNLNLHEKYHDITDLNEMGKLILVRALVNTNIAKLSGFDLDTLRSDVPAGVLTEAAEGGRTVREIGEKAVETVKEAAEDIKKKLKLPF